MNTTFCLTSKPQTDLLVVVKRPNNHVKWLNVDLSLKYHEYLIQVARVIGQDGIVWCGVFLYRKSGGLPDRHTDIGRQAYAQVDVISCPLFAT